VTALGARAVAGAVAVEGAAARDSSSIHYRLVRLDARATRARGVELADGRAVGPTADDGLCEYVKK